MPEHQLESIWVLIWVIVIGLWFVRTSEGAHDASEEQKKHAATRKLNPDAEIGFGTPGAINAVLVAMTFSSQERCG